LSSSRAKLQRHIIDGDHENIYIDADDGEQLISLSLSLRRSRAQATAPAAVSPVQKEAYSVRYKTAPITSAVASGSISWLRAGVGVGTGAASRPGSGVGVAGMDTGLLDKCTVARVETKPMKENPVVLTKKVVQKAGAGKSYSSPITPTVAASTPKTKTKTKTKTKPARLGQRYATSFLLSL
jgi:hypothetical protein